MNKYIELAKKLQKLAESGAGGEKENAEKMLSALMKKHNITKADIETEHRVACKFTLLKSQIKLFHQVVYSIIGRDLEIYSQKNRPTHKVVMATKAEEIEIRIRLSIYWQAYNEDLELFHDAFITKNHIFPPADKKSEGEEKEITFADIERINRTQLMAEGIQRKDINKQLTS